MLIPNNISVGTIIFNKCQSQTNFPIIIIVSHTVENSIARNDYFSLWYTLNFKLGWRDNYKTTSPKVRECSFGALEALGND